jgi:hypothetical protein
MANRGKIYDLRYTIYARFETRGVNRRAHDCFVPATFETVKQSASPRSLVWPFDASAARKS